MPGVIVEDTLEGAASQTVSRTNSTKFTILEDEITDGDGEI